MILIDNYINKINIAYPDKKNKIYLAANQAERHYRNLENILRNFEYEINKSINNINGSSDNVINSYIANVNNIYQTIETISEFVYSHCKEISNVYADLKVRYDLLEKRYNDLINLAKNEPQDKFELTNNMSSSSEYSSEYRKWNGNITSLKKICQAYVDAINKYIEYLERVDKFDLIGKLGYPKPYSNASYVTRFIENNVFTNGFDSIGNLEYFEWLTNCINMAGTVGLDQGIFRISFRNKNVQIWKLVHKFTDRGMSSSEVVDLFKIIDSWGACSYAAAAGNIVYRYHDNPEYFEEHFGFPLYIERDDGTIELNTAELLADLYLYINDTANGGEMFDTSNGEFEILKGSGAQRFFRDDETNSEMLRSYLSYHGIDIECKRETVFTTEHSVGILSPDELSDVKSSICAVIDDPNKSLDFFIGPNDVVAKNCMIGYDEDGLIKSGVDTIHATNCIGYNDDGVLINTWGGIYLYPWEFIEYNVGYGDVIFQSVEIKDYGLEDTHGFSTIE